MNHSESINELTAALAKAQGQIKDAAKDKANPFFKSTYADLSSIWDACRDALSSNGLSVIQSPEEAETGITIETMLCHSSGQWISSKYVMPVSKSDAQAVGSAITYGRRYALASMVGIAPADDDGNAATKAPPKTQPKKSADSAPTYILETKQLKACGSIDALATAWGGLDGDAKTALKEIKDQCKADIDKANESDIPQ